VVLISQKRIEDIQISDSVSSGLITSVQLIKLYEDFMDLFLKERNPWLTGQGLEKKK
jgi:hypothetical protein